VTLDGDKVNPSGELSGGAPSSSGSMLTQIMSVLDASKNLEIKQDQLNVLKQQLQNLERVGKYICCTLPTAKILSVKNAWAWVLIV
jgi:chromosome segregation ATPase